MDALRRQLGDKVVIQTTPVSAHRRIWLNNRIKPFSDVRVRRALSLAIDRYAMSRVLYPVKGLKLIAGLMRPGSEWEMSGAEFQRYPGSGEEADKNRPEARRLLTEAGYPNGFRAEKEAQNAFLHLSRSGPRGTPPSPATPPVVRG